MTTTNKVSWLNPPKAKDHPLLQDLAKQVEGCEIRGDFQICGHTYTLETLGQEEEYWADQYVVGGTLYQTGRNRRVPYVAAALRAIDGTAVEELFRPDDMPEEMRKAFAEDDGLVRRWRREAILNRIQDPERPIFSPPVLNELWVSYQTLVGRREAALEKIGPLSPKGTDTSASSPMSLLASMS